MAFDVLDWNIDPNQQWWVKMSEVAVAISIELFNTQADMNGGVNRVAHATCALGASVKVTVVTADATLPLYGIPLTTFNPTLGYYMIVKGVDLDAMRKFKMGPFTDLSPVQDPLMTTEQMIQDRATVEINRGTHSIVVRNFKLEEHDPASNEQDVLQFSSSKRSLVNVLVMMTDLQIEVGQNDDGSVDFFDQIKCVEYRDFLRE